MIKGARKQLCNISGGFMKSRSYPLVLALTSISVAFASLSSKSFSAKASVVSEFTGGCARVHINPGMNRTDPFRKIIKRAEGYEVWRATDEKKGFQKIYEVRFPQTVDELNRLLGVSVKEEDKSPKKKTIQKVIPSGGGNDLDIIRKGDTSLYLSALSPRMEKIMGTGYSECGLKTQKVKYRFVYLLPRKKRAAFPKKPIEIQAKKVKLYPLEVVRVQPIRGGAEIYFRPPAQKGDTFAFNLYVESGSKKKKRVRVNNAMMIVDHKKKEGKYVARNLKVGSEYWVYSTALSFAMHESPPGKKYRYLGRPAVPPKPVSRVKARLKQNGLEVTWSYPNQKNIAGFHVYGTGGNKPQSKFERINKVMIPPGERSYIHTTPLVEGKRYLYRVTVVDEWGNESSMSTAAFFDYHDKEKPRPPKIVSYGATEKGNFIKWEPPKGGPPIKGYLVYRSESIKAPAVPLTKLLTTREYWDKSAKPATPYWYTVRSVSKNQITSIYPAPVYVMTEVQGFPMPVKELKLIKRNAKLRIAWKKPSYPYLTGYKLLSGPSLNSLKPLATVESVEKTFLEIPMPSRPVWFRIYSVGFKGRMSKTPKDIQFEPKQERKLPRPTIHIARKGGRVLIYWNPERGLNKQQYEIFGKLAGSKTFRKVQTVPAKSLRVLLSNALSRQIQYIYVKATDPEGGQSVRSKVYPIRSEQ